MALHLRTIQEYVPYQESQPENRNINSSMANWIVFFIVRAFSPQAFILGLTTAYRSSSEKNAENSSARSCIYFIVILYIFSALKSSK